MTFKMKYEIKPKYIPVGTKRRSGIKMPRVRFVVVHDTGNDGSTAANNCNYYINSCNDQSASAHLFVDDKEILECVPLLTGTPEKAWHVLYNVTKDNELFGGDANDMAAGVELCWSSKGKINNEESYKRYVWVIAYIMFKFNLNPSKDIVSHKILDPARRSDPDNGLSRMGKTYAQLLVDIVTEYNACLISDGNEAPAVDMPLFTGVVKVDGGDTLNIRAFPTTSAVILGKLSSGTKVIVYEESGGWYRIGAGQWLSADFIIKDSTQMEDDEVMVLTQDWQWDMLVKALEGLYSEKKLTTDEWAQKAKNKTLTVSELAFVNTILLERLLTSQK